MFLAVLALLVVGYLIYISYISKTGNNPQPGTGNQNNNPPAQSDITVDTPKPNQEVQSPLLVEGSARGTWFFEAVFPVKLLDASGKEIATGQGHAIGDWMTTDFVAFSTSLDFQVDAKQNGTLVLQNDNPSGLPQNAKELDIPLVLLPSAVQLSFNQTGNLTQNSPGQSDGSWFLSYETPGNPGLSVQLIFDGSSVCKLGETAVPCQNADLKTGARVSVEGQQAGNVVVVKTLTAQEETSVQEKEITIYFYNPTIDKDASGNILCSRKGLVAVKRQIPVTQTPIQDTINLLLQGNLTDEEKNQGINPGFPLNRFALKSASLDKGILTLEFSDPGNKTSGGSCRASILWFQIETTARQFPGVNQVKFIPDTLFQP